MYGYQLRRKPRNVVAITQEGFKTFVPSSDTRKVMVLVRLLVEKREPNGECLSAIIQTVTRKALIKVTKSFVKDTAVVQV